MNPDRVTQTEAGSAALPLAEELRYISTFADLSDQDLAWLASQMTLIELAPGEINLAAAFHHVEELLISCFSDHEWIRLAFFAGCKFVEFLLQRVHQWVVHELHVGLRLFGCFSEARDGLNVGLHSLLVQEARQ